MLPLEIEERILDLLAEGDYDHSALKTCSLVCQAFLPICRKHIFGSIMLNGYVMSSTTHSLARLLYERPEIADYIRKLHYNVQVADLTSPSIHEPLKRISRLESLTISNYKYPQLDWSNNPIRSALLHFLHLPTLTHFEVTNVNNFVASDLIPCANLKYLNIGTHTTGATETAFPAALPTQSIQLNEFVAAIGTADAVMKLCTARRPDGQPVIDFGSLSKITVVLRNPNEGKTSQELFRRCRRLTDVQISFWDARNVRPSVADMLRPSMQTLKHIFLNICVDNARGDPLCGIPSELEDMRTKNIIESVTIEIRVEQTDTSCSGEAWGRLDEVLTTPEWFALKRVSLAIEIATYDSDDRLEVALLQFPWTQFPRLSTSNSVSFDFKVNPVWW